MVTRVVSLVALMMSVAGAAPLQQPERFIPMLDAGDTVPPIPLRAQDGRSFSLADFRGKALLVSFIYTRCGDARMCPLVTAKFARIARTIGTAPIALVLLTLDPQFDTPAVLRRYGRAFGQDPRVLTLATGSVATMNEFAGRLGIATSTTPAGGIIHTEAAVVIGPSGTIVRTIAGNSWTPADLIDSARAALPGRYNPFVGTRTWLGAALERCGGAGAAIGGGAMLAILGLAFITVSAIFWRAFRGPAGPRRPSHHPSSTIPGEQR